MVKVNYRVGGLCLFLIDIEYEPKKLSSNIYLEIPMTAQVIKSKAAVAWAVGEPLTMEVVDVMPPQIQIAPAQMK